MCKDPNRLQFFSVARIEEHNRNFQYVTRRVEDVLGRLDSGTGEPEKEGGLFEIRAKIRHRQEDFQKSLMILASGDVIQFKELKKCSIYEYLIKLDNFVSQVETLRGDHRNIIKNPALLRKPQR